MTSANLLTDNVATGTDTLQDTSGFTAGSCTLASSTTKVNEGSRSLEMTATSTATMSAWIPVDGSATLLIPVTAGKTYRVESWVQRGDSSSGGTSCEPYTYWYQASGLAWSSVKNYDRGTYVGASTTEWRPSCGIGMAPSDAVWASVRLTSGSGVVVGDKTYWDTISFKELAVGDNLLYPNQALGMDLGPSGVLSVNFTGTNATLAQSTDVTPPQGTYSLKLTASGTADVSAATMRSGLQGLFPVKPSTQYSVLGEIRQGDAVTGDHYPVWAVNWFTSAGAASTTPTSTSSQFPVTTTTFTNRANTFTSPSDAAFAQVVYSVQSNMTAGMTFYLDRMGLQEGDTTEWSDPTGVEVSTVFTYGRHIVIGG